MIKTFFAVLFLSVALLVGIVGYRVYTFFTSASANREIEVTVPEGTSFRQIANILKDNQVIADPYLFELLARVKGVQSRVHAGRYRFVPSIHPDDVLESLIKGQLPELSITIPEGWTMAQIAVLVAQKTNSDSSALLALMKNPEWLKSKAIPSTTAEGYLFPDTYAHDENTQGEALIGEMADTFHRRVDVLWKESNGSQLADLQQVVTLASIVEREAKRDEERSIIAAVYLNRLRIGMPLQADPTVIYGIQNFNGNLTRADLEADQSYNTYKNKGLPPTPIGNPGLPSINAVLHPAAVSYLYFVSKQDGTHQFSQTLDEQNKAVEQYQLMPTRSIQEEGTQ